MGQKAINGSEKPFKMGSGLYLLNPPHEAISMGQGCAGIKPGFGLGDESCSYEERLAPTSAFGGGATAVTRCAERPYEGKRRQPIFDSNLTFVCLP